MTGNSEVDISATVAASINKSLTDSASEIPTFSYDASTNSPLINSYGKLIMNDKRAFSMVNPSEPHDAAT